MGWGSRLSHWDAKSRWRREMRGGLRGNRRSGAGSKGILATVRSITGVFESGIPSRMVQRYG